jgi:hypothetical protein
MIQRPFRSFFRFPAFKYASKGLLIFLLLGFGFKSHGQSYFYFENQVSLAKDTSVTYYTFLILQNNGTGVARVLYIEPVSREKKLIEANLLDSADISGGINNANHYLIADGEPLPVLGAGTAGFRSPRILFKKQGEGENASFKPDAIMYHLPGKGWTTSQMLANQQKLSTELPREADLVKRFYSETDDVYGYMMDGGLGQRAILPRRKEKLYLISVANTLDPYIGATTQIDMANIVNTFTKLAEDMNMEIQVQKIMGSDLSVKSVEAALTNLRPSPIDIVIFYYSGHGFRFSDDKSLYPRISLRLDGVADLGKNNIGVEAIYKMLLKKKARVTLCISDCCNKDAGELAPVGPGLIIFKDPGITSRRSMLSVQAAVFSRTSQWQ